MPVFVVGWMIIIFYFSAQPARESSNLSNGVSYKVVTTCENLISQDWTEEQKMQVASLIEYPIRKMAHMSEYAMLAMILYVTIVVYRIKGRKRFIYPVLGVFLYACTDEFHQIFVPGRTGKITDVMIDTSGAIWAMLLIWIFAMIFSKINPFRKHIQ